VKVRAQCVKAKPAGSLVENTYEHLFCVFRRPRRSSATAECSAFLAPAY